MHHGVSNKATIERLLLDAQAQLLKDMSDEQEAH